MPAVGATEGARLPVQVEEPETFDMPRDRLGLPLLPAARLGCRLVWPGDVLKLTGFSSISLVGVGSGIERRKYFSEVMGASGSGGNSSVGIKSDVPGSNSLASGLNEKCLGDVAGDRLTWCGSPDGGIRVVEDLAW